MINTLQPIKRKDLLGHPIGLFILFFTEMWERFSYYGMRGILTLYVATSATALDPGLGWSNKEALWLYGWYTMLVYVASIPGGWIADRLIGQKKAVLIGGLLLCAGHGILAIPQDWAFFTGLFLIILGVGGLKPNISTMVGGLYQRGDIRRDSGFTIFYIGINLGAFLSSISVGLVAYYYGWHYGFGLAGIGMLLGQFVYMLGQKHLKGVGDYIGNKNEGVNSTLSKEPLTKVDKDRIIVLLLSFLIVIVFWGAFEQAGGLMNLYTDAKVDRYIGFSWLEEVPAAVFQSLNAGYIIIFGTLVASFWAWFKRKGKESSSLFKMAVGTIIMGLGYIFMMIASTEASAEAFGKAAMIWIFMAYLFHTIGELCTSPVALSFITKLAPIKYASIMMGIYFAATGLGNKLAGSIGESSQLEPYSGLLTAQKTDIYKFIEKDSFEIKTQKGLENFYDYPINLGKNFSIKTKVYPQGEFIAFTDLKTGYDVTQLFITKDSDKMELLTYLKKGNSSLNNPKHARLIFEKKADEVQNLENIGDGKNYNVSFFIEEQQSTQEYKTFVYLVIFTVAFGLLLIVFLKRLKKLTHGVEEAERDVT